ncbi:MAG: LysM peptidoglycan-binding domain-containing protein [Actinomycetota bacterium]|nr:LysM peptidoglycan-binding domain-containing protein [Actinomycetota bacterium]
MARGWRGELKRYGAPAAFLAAVTIAVLLVRSGLQTKAAPGTTSVATTRSTSTRTGTTIVKRKQFYRLRIGETLSDVAIRFKTTVEELLALNPGIEPTNLNVGQRIRVR